MSLRWPQALLAIVALSACDTPKLNAALAGFDATPRSIDFATAYIGHPRTVSVSVENRGAAELELKLRVAPPFSVDVGQVELSGGESRSVAVTFSPSTEGPAIRTLTISSGSLEPISIALSGDAEIAPGCEPADDCHASSFDADQAICVDRPLDDGAACGADNLCLTGASCVAGTCVGQTRSCDDQNICTQDACDPAQGCVHVSTTASCPPPSDPCHVATCDPESGCGIDDAPDWTPCGSMSCTEAHVCFSGSCLSVTPPDGIPCGDPTPCSAAPTCQSGACVQPTDGGTIPLLWSYEPPNGYTVDVVWLADAHGNVFWLDVPDTEVSDAGPEYLVSATPDGQVRFRVPAFRLTTYGGDGPDLVLADGVVIARADAPRGNSLVGLSADDGGVLWTTDALAPLTGYPQIYGFSNPLYNGSSKLIWALDRGSCAEPGAESTLLEMDLQTGALRSVAQLPDHDGGSLWLTSLARDHEGRVVALASGCPFVEPAQLIGWDLPTAQTIEFPGAGHVIATADDVMVTDDRDIDRRQQFPIAIRSMRDGGVLARLNALDGGVPFNWGTEFVLNRGVAYALAQAGNFTGSELTAYSESTGQPLWRRTLPGQARDMVLSNRGSLLIARQAALDGGPGGATELRLDELLTDGGLGFSCRLGDDVSPLALSVLGAGRWVTIGASPRQSTFGTARIVAFSVPSYDVADSGWVAPGGNMERNGYVQ